MTDTPGDAATHSIAQISAEITEWRKGRGFYTPESLATEAERDMMLGKLMLVVSECAEAGEAVRHEDMANFSEEIADAVIRLFDIANSVGLDLERAIEQKMAVNKARPMRHGKRCSL